jgi:hypothetical protein
MVILKAVENSKKTILVEKHIEPMKKSLDDS